MASTPFPYLPAVVLRHAYGVLTGRKGPVADAVTFDARSFGADADSVTVTLRDLHFIHSLDATRFGSHHECPLCADDIVDARQFEETA